MQFKTLWNYNVSYSYYTFQQLYYNGGHTDCSWRAHFLCEKWEYIVHCPRLTDFFFKIYSTTTIGSFIVLRLCQKLSYLTEKSEWYETKKILKVFIVFRLHQAGTMLLSTYLGSSTISKTGKERKTEMIFPYLMWVEFKGLFIKWN